MNVEILRMESLRIEARAEHEGSRKAIVDGVDLLLHRGEVLGLIGESGAGKSTIGLATLGYTRPGCSITGGKILFEGVDLRRLSPDQRRRLRGRRIAYVGVSRTETGEFLSSDDVELIITLANYVGIAIENANLMQSLQSKVVENERLKEFSENIVESINVGVLAVDLDDRVES